MNSRNSGLAACLMLIIAGILLNSSCARQNTNLPAPQPSTIEVSVNPSGPAVVRTAAAEFQVLPSGYIKASLLRNGSQLTLDNPQSSPSSESDHVISKGKPVGFALDFSQARVVDSQGKLGRGKRIEIPAKVANGIQPTLALEAYDDLPNVLLTTMQL